MLIYDNQESCDLGGSIKGNKTSELKKKKSLIIQTHCVYFCRVFLLTQLHWGARLVNRVLTGAQAVLQLGGGSLRRRGGTDGVGRVGWVYQRGGGSGRGGPRGAWGRRVRDFTPRLTAPTSSATNRTGQTRAPRGSNSKWSPAEERGERHVTKKVFWSRHRGLTQICQQRFWRIAMTFGTDIPTHGAQMMDCNDSVGPSAFPLKQCSSVLILRARSSAPTHLI